MAKNKGFIILARSIFDHWLWNDKEPYCHRAAWIDLLLLASHDEHQYGKNGSFRVIQRGQIHTSISNLASRWRWSENKVRRFLRTLMCDNMCTLDSSTGGTLITLVNYGKIQDAWRTDGSTNGSTDGSTGGRVDGRVGGTHTKNYTKNYRKNYKEISTPTGLSDDELKEKLRRETGEIWE